MASADATRRIDAVCDRFEQQLQAGESPGLKPLLEQLEEALQPVLLRQLLLLQWDYEGRRNTSIDLQSYLDQFPEHAELIQSVAMEHLAELEHHERNFREAACKQLSATFVARMWEDSNYQVLRRLGDGAMGAVWLAKERSTERLVAMKILRHDLRSNQYGFERFRMEVRALQKLAHPNIVCVFDVNVHLDKPFYTMEYCPGGNLAVALRDRRPTPREAAELVETLANAVQAAHEAGIVHRDLKPANVLLQTTAMEERGQGDASESADENALDGSLFSQRFTPKLADFGLAKDLGAESISHMEDLLGSPAYMAPEQIENPRAVSGSVDIHALGAILHECLTGRPPFQGATPLKTIQRILLENVTPPRHCEPLVPRGLSAICVRCLEKNPADRYSTARELADDLRRFLNDKAVRARTPNVSWRLLRWGQKYPLQLTVLTAICILSAALIAGWNLHKTNPQEPADASVGSSLPNVTPGSLRFDDNIAVLPKELLDGLESGTIEFWVKFHNHPGESHRNDVFLEVLDKYGRDFFAISYQTGYIKVYDGRATTPFGDRTLDLRGSWNHICYVRDYDNQMASVYFNGYLLGVKDFNAEPTVSLEPISVGEAHIGQDATGWGQNYTTGESLHGMIADLRVWNVVRAEHQIKANIRKRLNGAEPGLLANYQFLQASESRTADATGRFGPLILGDFFGPDADDRRSAPIRIAESPYDSPTPSRTSMDVLSSSSEQFTFEGRASTTTPGGKLTVVSDQHIVVDTSQDYELSVFASARDAAGGQLDPNSVHYIGIISYDIDGHEIRPWNFMKHAEAVDTTLAVDLEPGDMTITLTDATGWYDGPDRNLRGLSWYGYENSQGEIYPDYSYTRHTSFTAWDEHGIDGNVITLRVRWNGPALRAGEPVRNAGFSYQHNYRFLAPGHVTVEGQYLRAPIGGVNLSGKINRSKFRPGTHSIAACALADYNNTGTQLTLTNFKLSHLQHPAKKLVGH